MTTFIIALLAVLAATAAAAGDNQACAVAAHFISPDHPLPRVKAAIADKRLDVVVVGSASSRLDGATDNQKAYPARLEAALAERLPGVAVKVVAYARPRETAALMAQQIERSLSADKPALVVWQTGTVEAMRRIDMDQFQAALEAGFAAAQSGKSDIILMNMQYSPRTETMIAVPPYAETMRFVALQHEVLLFDRFAVMRHWSELGTFDFVEATKKIDTAARVHDCIGRLLADLIVQAAMIRGSSAHNGKSP